MPFFESGFLAKLLDHATQARRLFSNPQKPERERMVVRAFLRSIGEAFDDSEITPSREEPVDTRFRTAEFQIMEIVGTRRRGLDWRRREDKYRNAQGIADVIEPYTPSQPLSLDDTGRLLADRLARKAARYGAETCSALDALVYVDLHGRHLWPLTWSHDVEAIGILQAQAWRSVSMLFAPYGAVLLAAPRAPDFLRARAGQVLNAWSQPDGLFEP
jgi:Putative endonuclease, protein of unknown function (DUF1780)